MPSGREEWIAVVKAIYSRFGDVQVTDRAAAMTYYSILSVFSALLVAVSLLTLLGTAYISHFGSYDKTYGTLGALISLLIWLWLGNLAFLIGALFNAETRRVRDEHS